MVSSARPAFNQQTEHPRRRKRDIEQDKGNTPNTPWIARADELAEWAWALVNRADVWGGYHSLRDRGREYSKDGKPFFLGHVTTRPLPRDRGKVYLSKAILVRHFQATAPEHVVGLHTTSPTNTSLWGAVEVDQHGDGGNTPEANLAASLAWYADLARRGFRPLLTDSNGKGGYHLRFLLAAPAPTALVFHFLKALTADWSRHGLTAPPETFPKQPRVTSSGPGSLGNWLRLPGRHHTREHWSRVWNGYRWLDGAEAVAFLLTFQGDPAELVPPEAPPPKVRVTVRFVPAHPSRHGGCSLDRRINAYMSRLPNLALGQGRDDVAFRFSTWLVRDLALSDAAALTWLEQWDRYNQPPKGTDRLREILENARSYGTHAVGCAMEGR